jgi:hypothetical protein
MVSRFCSTAASNQHRIALARANSRVFTASRSTNRAEESHIKDGHELTVRPVGRIVEQEIQIRLSPRKIDENVAFEKEIGGNPDRFRNSLKIVKQKY